MEALSNYFSTLPNFKHRIFISNPPGPALLIWTNRDFLPNISGISIVEQEGQENSDPIKSSDLIEILRKQLFGTVPVLHIIYNIDMTELKINGISYELLQAAKIISDTFKIAIGNNPAKAPNDPAQIKDPFHIWSREAFDGRTVMKTDIDFLLTRDNKITSIWEVKRSATIKVGRWMPYVDPNRANDINNYYMLTSLSNLLKVKMFTVHHEEMNSDTSLNAHSVADFYVYNPQPNQETLNLFATRKKNTTQTLGEALKIG